MSAQRGSIGVMEMPEVSEFPEITDAILQSTVVAGKWKFEF
jgi:hypothetical protein